MKNKNSCHFPTYGWWTKSCTTKDDDYPIVYRVLTIPGGAGFCPSTVLLLGYNLRVFCFDARCSSFSSLKIKKSIWPRRWRRNKWNCLGSKWNDGVYPLWWIKDKKMYENVPPICLSWSYCWRKSLAMAKQLRLVVYPIIYNYLVVSFFFSPPNPGEMIQFDGCICFKWVGSTTN